MTTPVTPATAPASSATAAAASTPVDPKVAEAARGFEGIFMSFLVEEMMGDTGLAASNPLYAGLMTEKLGDALAEAGGIGLAAVLERQMSGGGA